jgi:hypothetical protein
MQMVAKLLFLSPVVSIVCWLSQEEVSIPVEMRGGEACLAEAVLQDFYVIICHGVILYSLKDVADPIWGVIKCYGGDD